MTSNHLHACLALSSVEISAAAWHRVVEYFGGVEEVLGAADQDLDDFRGISAQVRSRIRSARDLVDRMDEAVEKLEKMGAFACPFDDPRYPVLLKQIADPPGLIYVRGDLTEQDRFAVSIVGSRNPRPYGLEMSGKLAKDLALAGLTVVSGGARGIDSAAHEGALRGGGRTIAVLGCGIDIAYPAENKDLFERMASSGAVISEFPLGAAPEAWRFPRRNRIISGLSRGVIVCDAPEDSGALITATCAAEQGRDVFAVPGNVDNERNRGAHRLLKDGAKLVESADDVLEEFGLDSRPSPESGGARSLPPVEVSADEKCILEMLDLDPLPLDDIIEKSEMPASDVAGVLTFLEMKRLVKRVAGPAYVRVLR